MVIAVLMAAGFVGIFWFLVRSKRLTDAPRDDTGLNNMFLMMQNQINEVTRTLDSRLNESNKVLQSQFGTSTRVMQDVADKNAKIVQEVTEKLVKLDETNRQVVSFADQLKNLQDILKNPKQRGIVGEYYLQTVLENVLPPGTF